MSAAEAYDESEARLGSLECAHCDARSPLVPLHFDGSLSDVVAARVRAFSREHHHDLVPQVRITLPMPVMPRPRAIPRCRRCGERGHRAADCRKAELLPRAVRRELGRCAWCSARATGFDDDGDPQCRQCRALTAKVALASLKRLLGDNDVTAAVQTALVNAGDLEGSAP